MKFAKGSTRIAFILPALLLAVVTLGLWAASGGGGAGENVHTLTVFAAASLTDAFTEIGAAFEAANPGVAVVFNFAGSSTLAAQLAEGTAADVFASADQAQMQGAQDAGRIAGPVQMFAHNRLVLAVPLDNPARIESLHDLATPGVLIVTAAPGVPIRTYTDQVLERLAADPDYGSAFRAAVQTNVVSEESNVRQLVAKIALGEADAAIVYQTDITPDLAGAVRALPIPDTVNVVASYPIAILHDAPHPALARAFVEFVLSDAGQDILARWGFASPFARAAGDRNS